MQNTDGKLHFEAELDTSKLQRDAEQGKRALQDIGQTAQTSGKTIDNSMQNVSQTTQRTGKTIDQSMHQASDSMNQAGKTMQNVGDTIQRESEGIEKSMSNIGKAVAGIFVLSQLKEFATQVATVRGEFQQLEIAFGTMLGSKQQADALMSQLIETAVITPFNMSDLANSAKQLLAYGVAADEVNETLVRLGDIAAGLSIPINDLAYLYGTTMVQGRLYTQDLNQFLGRGIPLTEELAKQFGVAQNNIKELAKDGKIGFENVKQAIVAMTSEGGKFGGLMEAQSKSITGQMSNIEDGIEQMYNELGKKMEGVISSTLDGIGMIIDNWESIGKAILPVLAAYGAYKAALLAVWAVQKAMNIAGAISAFFSLAKSVTSVKDAMTLLNMVTSKSPIGLIAAVIGGAAVALGLFSDSTNEAAIMTEKYGESAAKTLMRIDVLTDTLKGLTEGSTTHKKVMDELNDILKEFGVTQIKEGDNIDSINKKREQAIELIKLEAIERQRANNISAGEERYNTEVKEAREGLYNDLSSAVTGQKYWIFDDYSANDQIRAKSEQIATIIGDIVENNISLIANKTGKEYEDGVEKIYQKIQTAMRQIGIDEETIAETWMDNDLFGHSDIIAGFIDNIKTASEKYNIYRDDVNRVADAEKKAAEATMTFDEKVRATERSLRGASGDVDTLYKNIKNLMSKYNHNTIGFDITFNAVIPKWMYSKDIPELQRLAAWFTATGNQAAQSGKKGVNVNGKWFSTEDLLQRGADYAEAAKRKQDEADKAQSEYESKRKEREAAAKAAAAKADAAAKAAAQERERQAAAAEAEAKRKAEEKKREAERAAAEAKRKAEEKKREQERIEEQTTERNKSIKDYNKKVIEQTESSELDIRQKKLDLLEEGYEKEKQQIDLNYERLKAENEKREKDMINSLADKKMLEWMNENPKATHKEQIEHREFLLDESNPTHLTKTDLSADQQAQLKAYEDIANQIKEQSKKQLYERLLAEYQDYEERRKKINEEYDRDRKALEAAPIDETQRARAIEELEKKRKEAIQAVNNEEIQAMQKSSSLLVDLFSDAADKSDKEIRKLISDTNMLLSYLKNTADKDITPKFGFTAEQLKMLKASPEQMKALGEQVKKLEDIARKSNPFRALANDIKNLFKKPKDGEKQESLEARLKKVSESAAECADMIGDVAGKLSEMFEASGNQSAAEAMEAINDVASSVSNVAKGFAQGGLIGGIAAAAGEAIGYVTKAFQASARHKEALKEIMKEVTAQQHSYNLALLDESLAMEKANTVFGSLEYKKAANSVYVMKTAFSDLKTEIANLSDIEIKTGHKKTGLFGWGKGKDTFSSILEVYPELVDAQGNFNKALAQSIIESRTFKGEGREALQYMIDLAEKADEAFESMKDYLSGIFGELGNTMSDALLDAFQNGTDAALAFGDKVEEMLSNIAKQMIFSTLFGSLIQEANEQMLDVMNNVTTSEEEKFNQYINILDTMTSGILGQQGNYNALIEKYQKLAEAKGVSLFDSADYTSRSATQKGIATASQDSINELNGRMTAVQSHTYSICENTKLIVNTVGQILKSVMGIETNTDSLPSRLESIESDLATVKNTVNDISIKGIKIR